MNIEIPQIDFATLCICALRYCHGRQTYMPSLIMRIVGEYLPEMTERDINIMLNDCITPPDKDWESWKEVLQKEKEFRRKEKE